MSSWRRSVTWSKEARFDSAALLKYIDTINAQGGCLTLDVRTLADGTIQPVLLETLLPLGRNRDLLTNSRIDESLRSPRD